VYIILVVCRKADTKTYSIRSIHNKSMMKTLMEVACEIQILNPFYDQDMIVNRDMI